MVNLSHKYSVKDQVNSDSASGISQNTSYVDGNGNVTQSKLDASGQRISSLDGEGGTETVKRNEENLVTSKTDARGNETKYTYDEQGNVY